MQGYQKSHCAEEVKLVSTSSPLDECIKRCFTSVLGQKPEATKILLFAGQKGSDVSAREATKKLVAATKQMHALQAVLQDIHGVTAAMSQKLQASDENAKFEAAEAGPWAAKNTIVRDVLNELTNAAQKSRRKRLQGIAHAAFEHKGNPTKH